MDIEKLIEQLHIAGAGNPGNIFDEAADALSTLQAENEKLRAELKQVKAERDAAQRLLAEHTGVVGMEKVTTCAG